MDKLSGERGGQGEEKAGGRKKLRKKEKKGLTNISEDGKM